ncbi:proline-serine-threonine phosphatase-interacting protein 2 [Biomphalaria pfeifferi]|uniref:Proline-serine-threonine phosphatase-interacting protein 2 n=1 Tax=Biomphalaria pfeifferi TaxID=112525 RepID=A0AAD8C1U1_BIOPF|nr:proline-serine-threonine phosphatase-interacting protein 2 [Biomphalaria pfeifferi]
MPSWETMDHKCYENVFWGEDLSSVKGYEVLVQRNSDSKKILNDLEEYLKKRSRLELDYSKSLSGLARTFRQRDDMGVLEATMTLLKTELDSMANYHNKASISFQQHADNVKKFKEDQTNRRKLCEDNLNKIQNSKLSQLKITVQSEKLYVKKCSERDIAQAAFKETSINQVSVPKDIEKAKSRFSRATEDAEKADTQYKSAVMVLEDCRILWENEMISACQSIQAMDEERIKFMRQEIWDTTNIDSQLALDIDRSCESVREVLEKCDIVTDIQAFISKYKTGEIRPEPFSYKHYTKIQTMNDNDSDLFSPYSTIGEEQNTSDTSSTGTRTFFGFAKKKGAAL